MKSVKAEKKITSNVFFKKLVPEVLKTLNSMEVGEHIVLDFSATESVDAMAIPLLLSMARWIIGSMGTVPQIYIPNLSEKENLKEYLEKVGFFNICDFYDYYEVNTERHFVKRDPANFVTYVFTENAQDDSQEERERIEDYVCKKLTDRSYPLFWNYWTGYDVYHNSNSPSNIVEWMIRSICANTGIHTKENGVLTLQRNLTLNRVCISLADCGQGLFATFKEKIKRRNFKPASLSPNEFEKLHGERADLYAIVEALTYRFLDKNYGLYQVLIKSLELEEIRIRKESVSLMEENEKSKWIMRIHSNQKRMIFSWKICKGLGLETAKTREQFAQRILMLADNPIAAQTTSDYPGVHIEIEIPYNREKMWNG